MYTTHQAEPLAHANDFIGKARDEWIRKLIDVTRNNNLLYFREGKTTTLDISSLSKRVFASLVRNMVVTSDALLDDLQADKRQGAVVFRSIYRKARENDEEKGLKTLFVAIGMATWQAEDEGRPYYAPLLLMPIRMTLLGVAGAHNIQRDGDFQINPVLVHVLQSRYNIHVPIDELQETLLEDSLDLDRFFERFTRSVERLKGVRLLQQQFIGNFSFQKMVMVADLNQSPLLATHPVIAALAGDTSALSVLRHQGSTMELRDLDRVPRHDEFLIMDADSSQERVIHLVGNGQSGVIQGPPGTGKSQTIANMIATQIAKGKRVLFVAEKRAALDVVYERLKHVGLHHIILDLHGADVSRRTIMKKLASSFEHSRSVVPADISAESRAFDQYRTKLNFYSQRTHTKPDPAQQSAYDLYGRLLQLGASAQNPVIWPESIVARLNPQVLQELQRVLLVDERTASLYLHRAAHPHPRHDSPGSFTISPWESAISLNGERMGTAQQLVFDITIALRQFVNAARHTLRHLKYRPPSQLDEARELLAHAAKSEEYLRRFAPTVFERDLAEQSAMLQQGLQSPIRHLWLMITNANYRATFLDLRRQALTPIGRRALRDDLVALVDLQVKAREYTVDQRVRIGSEESDCGTLLETLKPLIENIRQLEVILQTTDLASWPFERLEAYLAALEQDSAGLVSLRQLWDMREIFERYHTQSLLDYFTTQQIPHQTWPDHLHYAWYRSLLEVFYRLNPTFRSFTGTDHAQTVREFGRVDQEHIQRTPQRILQLHSEAVFAARNEHTEQDALVKREISDNSPR